LIVNPNQINSDQDSHGDACDNCPSLDNENQADFDQDNIGDECCQKNYKIQPIGQVLSCCNDVDGTDQWRRYEIEIHVYDPCGTNVSIRLYDPVLDITTLKQSAPGADNTVIIAHQVNNG